MVGLLSCKNINSYIASKKNTYEEYAKNILGSFSQKKVKNTGAGTKKNTILIKKKSVCQGCAWTLLPVSTGRLAIFIPFLFLVFSYIFSYILMSFRGEYENVSYEYTLILNHNVSFLYLN